MASARGAARREELVETARNVLIADGLDGFVLRRIAELAGVRLGNLQYYFATRSDLIAAVVRHELELDLDSVDREAPARPQRPEEALRTFIEAFAERWTDGATDVYLPAAMLARNDPTIAAAVDEVWLAVYDDLARVVMDIDPTAEAAEAYDRAVLITALLDGASLQRTAAAGVDTQAFLGRVTAQAKAIASNALDA